MQIRHETLNQALLECVQVCGGSKAVGAALWPAKGVEAGRTRLLACLDDGRPEKLSPDEVLLLARMAREKGCHAYAEWVAHDLGYQPPQPADPDDVLADLLRKQNELAALQVASSQRIEKLLKRKAPRGGE
jgi:hypothetical protein